MIRVWTPALSRAYLALDRDVLQRTAQSALVTLAVCVGFGDIARVNPVASALLTGVYALLWLALGLGLLVTMTSRRRSLLAREIALPLGVWLLVQVASAAIAPSHRADALATLGRAASGALLLVAVVATSQPRSAWLRLGKALALGSLLVASIALAEATGNPVVLGALAALRDGAIPIGDVPRVAATLSHPNATAMLLELGFPLLIAWAWTSSGQRRVLVMLAAVATLGAIVLTFSRAGIATALFSLGLLVAIALIRREPRRAVAVGLLAVVVPLALGWSAVAYPGLDRRIFAGLDESSSLQPPRTEFWSVATQMAADYPLLGVGPDNFRWLFDSYSGAQANNLGIHAHNQYLETAADTGVLGLAAFLVLLASLLLGGARALRAAATDWPWRAAVLASLSAWLVHALVDDFERFWPTSVAFWLIAGMIATRTSD
jgi:O-antigen ligase/polysaccharide polymerase Wzy-like membrane protein